MKKLLLFGVAAMLTAGIASCTKDADQIGGGTEESKPLDSDQTFFANISVRGSQEMSRADWDDDSNGPSFDKGEDYENKVQSIYLIFYDKDGNRVSTTQVRKDFDKDKKYPADQTGSQNSYYEGVVQIDVKHGSLPPTYVMAFVNPITTPNFEINPDFETLKTLERTTRDQIIDANYNFAMSKSVYYGIDTSKPKEKQEMEKIIVTPFVTAEEGKQLFTSEAEALEALKDPNSVVEIYVERYAAKVSLDFEKKSGEISYTFNDIPDHTLTFKPEYWAVNAYEKTTYIAKSFLQKSAMRDTDSAEDAQDNLTYAQINQALGGTAEQAPWHWNSPAYHRCYWAQTPAYYAEHYPRVADDILDKATTFVGEDYFALGYYSYDEMQENADNENGYSITHKARNIQQYDEGEYKMIYARENTISGTALHNAYDDPAESPKAAIASAVIVGRYQLDGKDIPDGTKFYVMGNKTNGYSLYEEDDMLDYFLRTTIQFSLDTYGRQSFFDYTKGTFNEGQREKYAKYFQIVHPSYDVRGDLVIDSRFVTIQLNTEELLKDDVTLYAVQEGEWRPITDYIAINTQMFYAAGTAQGFDGGRAYFTIPIQHLGYYRAGNPNANTTANNKDFDWKEVRTGDFGLVRNHSYSIVVENIIGLGNGIPDPSDPIVPPTDPEEYFIGARMIVLNWAVVPEQRVTL